MAGRGKSKQARVNKLSPRLKEDRISQLPDDLICQILSHLPIKEVVTTSVLSTRWRSLWLLVPCVDLNSQKSPDFNAFVSFGDMFSNSGRVSKVTKMIICRDTFKVIHHYSKLKPLPQFDYMSRLEVTLCVSHLKWLPTFLEHFPNLNALALVLGNCKKIHTKEMKIINSVFQQMCLNNISCRRSMLLSKTKSGDMYMLHKCF